MPPRRPRSGSAGFSLLELLLVTSIIATLSVVSIPLTAAALDEVRTAMAARYLKGRIMNARMTAIRRSTKVALRFEAVDGDYRYGEYRDGNGNRPPTSRLGSIPRSLRRSCSATAFPAPRSAFETICPRLREERRGAPTVSGLGRAGFSLSGLTAPPRLARSTCAAGEDSLR